MTSQSEHDCTVAGLFDKRVCAVPDVHAEGIVVAAGSGSAGSDAVAVKVPPPLPPALGEPPKKKG